MHDAQSASETMDSGTPAARRAVRDSRDGKCREELIPVLDSDECEVAVAFSVEAKVEVEMGADEEAVPKTVFRRKDMTESKYDKNARQKT